MAWMVNGFAYAGDPNSSGEAAQSVDATSKDAPASVPARELSDYETASLNFALAEINGRFRKG